MQRVCWDMYLSGTPCANVYNKNEDAWAYLDHCLILSVFRVLLIVTALVAQRIISLLMGL